MTKRLRSTSNFAIVRILLISVVGYSHGFLFACDLSGRWSLTQSSTRQRAVTTQQQQQQRQVITTRKNHQPKDMVVAVESRRRQVVATMTAFSASLWLGLALAPTVTLAAYIDPQTNPPKVTHQVYLDVQIGDSGSSSSSNSAGGAEDATNNNNNTPPRRITINLFGEIMPRTVQHFIDTCRDNGYAGTCFYRVLSDYNIQGGGNSKGQVVNDVVVLEPDNFDLQHTRAGLVSMVRTTPAAGGMDQRFFIQCTPDGGWADDRYAAFGIVHDDSMAVVRDIEKVPVKRPANAPIMPVTIVGSGIVSQ